MNTTTVFVIVALALLVLAFFTYMHKKHVRFNKEDLTLKTKKIFAAAGSGSIEEKKYLYGLRHEYDCSLKEAHYLFGKACENGIVKVEDKMVTLG